MVLSLQPFKARTLPVFLTSLSSSCSAGEALTYMQATTRVWHAGQGKPKGRWDHCHQKAEDRGTPAIMLQLNTPVACFAWTCPSKDLLIVPILIPVEHPTPPTQQAIHLSQEGKWKNTEVTFQPVTSEISEKDPGNAAVGIKRSRTTHPRDSQQLLERAARLGAYSPSRRAAQGIPREHLHTCCITHQIMSGRSKLHS